MAQKPQCCPICKQYAHVSPGSMTPENLYRHRITENRDCPKYEDCLSEAALVDAVMVPCITCGENLKRFSKD